MKLPSTRAGCAYTWLLPLLAWSPLVPTCLCTVLWPSSVWPSFQRLHSSHLCLWPLNCSWIWYWVGTVWFEVRWHLRQVVEHPAFGQFFLLAIIANTVLLAMTTAGGWTTTGYSCRHYW